jgi:hypothetical protein
MQTIKEPFRSFLLLFLVALGFFLIVATGDSSNKSAPGTPPQIRILSPENGAAFDRNNTISFVSQITGSADSLQWSSTRDGVLGTQSTFTRNNLSAGSHTITLVAGNVHGANSASVDITVAETTPPSTDPPQITLVSPETDAVFEKKDLVTFVAQVTDVNEGILSGTALKWYSSREDYLGFGTTLHVNFVQTGTHTITLVAKNNLGVTNSASIRIAINPEGNTPPDITIVQPMDGAKFRTGELVTFHGEATDKEEGTLTGNKLTWTSSKDKQIGTGNSFSRDDLSKGTHTITLEAKDSHGIPGVPAQITIHVDNTPPVARIDHPATGQEKTVNTPVLFIGSAYDEEDGLLPDEKLQWVSSRDGNLGYGATFTKNNLSVGAHTITLIATDKDGGRDIQSITLTITP